MIKDSKSIRRFKPAPLALAVVLAATGLLGCGGGGSSNVRPDPPPPERQPPTVSVPRAIEGAAPVTVAVMDTDFRVTHSEFAGRVIGAWFVENGSTEISNENLGGDSDRRNHGTPVAALVAGNTVGVSADASLRLIRLTSPGWGVAPGHFVDAIAYAAEQNDRVLSASFSLWTGLMGGLAGTILEPAVMASSEGRGMLVVTSGGNQSEAVPVPSIINHGLYQQLLVVGGSVGYDRHPVSNYPGNDPAVQARWLMAPYWAVSASNVGDDAYHTVGGTSTAQPQVAGMAAVLFAQWPHLSASVAAQRLLDTADRTSHLYADNTCGAAGNLNCGFYYLGQGHADLEAALAPAGILAVPAGSQVEGPGHALAKSGAVWSNAFGAVVPASAALFADTVAFDALGRDYRIDPAAYQGSGVAHARRVFERMQDRLAPFADTAQAPVDLGPDVRLHARHHPWGELSAARVEATLGSVRLSAFGQDGEREAPPGPLGGWSRLAPYAEAGATDLRRAAGIAAAFDLGPAAQLEARHWSGQTATTSLHGSDLVHRQDLVLRLRAAPGWHWNIGYGQVQESDGLLGTRGRGALALGGHRLGVTSLGMDYALGEQWAFHAHYGLGQGHGVRGGGLIRAVDGLRTEQGALGLRWHNDRHQVTATVQQPLRVSAGTITASVPVGRTLDGEVVRETRTASLRAEGRQTDFELGYAFAPSRRSLVSLNLLYSDQPDHERGAAGTFAGLAHYAVRF